MNSVQTLNHENQLELQQELKHLLHMKQFEEAKSIIKTEKYCSTVYLHSPDIIPILANNINRDIFQRNHELFACCETLLYEIAELACPDDSLLEFIEYAEKTDDILFSVMLKAMQISLLKIICKRGCAVTWCLSTIIRHINDLPQSQDLNLEGEDCIILENTESSYKAAKLYEEVLRFLGPLISFLFENDFENCEVDMNDTKNIVLTFLIKLLGRPLVYMDLENRKSKSDFRLIAERILDYINCFHIELTHFLYFVTQYNSRKRESVSDVVDFDYNNLSLGVLYYLIFHENICLDKISFVYHPLFMLEMIATLSLEMLLVEHSKVQYKGLLLFETILSRISEKFLCINDVDGALFGKMTEVLSNIMIYSNVQENRKIAVRTFKILLKKFNSQGQYYILYNIQNKVTQSNFIGYIITITKDFIVEALNNKEPMNSEYFTGANLCSIMKKFCRLPEGAESDLIELSDQIISSLNLVRYLLIRDKDNASGISDFVPTFEKDFLKPLKTGLSLTVAHYKLQKTEFKNDTCDGKLSLTVGGVLQPSLTSDQKMSILETALTTLDVIQSLVARVEECLEDYKLFLVEHKTK